MYKEKQYSQKLDINTKKNIWKINIIQMHFDKKKF